MKNESEQFELECINCSFCTTDQDIIKTCNIDEETGNAFCPKCKYMAIVTDNRK